MKNPKEIWNDLHPIGKCFAWWIIPTYYLGFLFLAAVALILYGLYAAWCDME